jgi:hypothetical protein
MQRLVKFAYGASTALNAVTNVVIPLQQSALESKSDLFPSAGLIDHIEIEVTAKSTATSITWFLAWDAAGDRPITPATTSAITVGATTATVGGAMALISANYKQPDDGVQGKVYLVAKSDAGTPTIEARLFVEW